LVAALVFVDMTEEQDLAVPAGEIVSDPTGSQVRKDAISRYQETHGYNGTDGFVCMLGRVCEASGFKRPGTWTRVRPMGSPTSLQDATAGTSEASDLANTPVTCRNDSNDRSAVTVDRAGAFDTGGNQRATGY